MGIPIGIDLGTTYSTISKWVKRPGFEGSETYHLNKEASTVLASKVYFEDDNDIVVGKLAKSQGIIDPENLVELSKRDLDSKDIIYSKRGKTYNPEDISSFIIDDLLSEVTSTEGKDFIPSGIVLTVPYYFKHIQNLRTKNAIENAIDKRYKEGNNLLLDIIPEPIAALLDYIYTNELEIIGTQNILIFDLGGGTLDVTVANLTVAEKSIKIEVLAVDGDNRLGGEDFDIALLNWVCRETGLGIDSSELHILDAQKLAYEVKNIKEALSDRKYVDLFYTTRVSGESISIRVTRDNLVSILEGKTGNVEAVNFLSKIEQRVDSVVLKSLLEKEDISKVILVGGSSKLDAVKTILKDNFPKSNIINSPKTDTTVSRGASLYATFLLDKKNNTENSPWDNIEIIEKTKHQIGIENNNNFYKVVGGNLLIPSNYSIPIRKKVDPNSDSFFWDEVTVLQGNKKDYCELGKIGGIEEIFIHGRSSVPAKLVFYVTDKNLKVVLNVLQGNRDKTDLIIEDNFLI